MSRNLRIYFRLLNANIKTLASFRIDFLLLIISGTLTQILGVVFIFTIFNNIPNIQGWTLNEIILIYSLVFLVEGLVSIFFDGVWNLTSIVNSGKFDRILVRPVSPFIQIATLGFGSQGIGNFIVGFILLIYSLISLDILTWKNLVILIFIFLGVIIRASINFCVSATSFWTKNGNPLMMANQSLSEFSKYPITIYSLPLKILVTLIPYAFIGYIPVIYILDKGSAILLFLYPLITIYSVYCACFIVNKGIYRYDSSGN